MFCVYAIESISTGQVYIGQTKDVDKRLRLHNSGLVKSTSKEAPWSLMAVEEFDNRVHARWCEKLLKKSRGKRIKWIEQHHL